MSLTKIEQNYLDDIRERPWMRTTEFLGVKYDNMKDAPRIVKRLREYGLVDAKGPHLHAREAEPESETPAVPRPPEPRLAGSTPNGNLNRTKVYDAISAGLHTRQAIFNRTGLPEGQLKHALYSLRMAGRIIMSGGQHDATYAIDASWTPPLSAEAGTVTPPPKPPPAKRTPGRSPTKAARMAKECDAIMAALEGSLKGQLASDIGRAIGLHSGAMRYRLQQLLEQGKVRRRRDTGDKRGRWLYRANAGAWAKAAGPKAVEVTVSVPGCEVGRIAALPRPEPAPEGPAGCRG